MYMPKSAVIVFFILDKRDNSFKKIYFTGWQDLSSPNFSEDKHKAVKFKDIDELYFTLDILHKAESTFVKTLNITTELY